MVNYNRYELLYSFLIYTVIVPISIGLFRRKFLGSKELCALAFLTILLFDEIFSVICIAFHIRNHFLYYIQTVGVLFTVAGYYGSSIWEGKLTLKLAIIVTLIMLVEVFFWVGFNRINSLTLTISRLLPAIYAVISLKRLFLATKDYSLAQNPTLYSHFGFFIIGSFTAINACFMSYFIETSLDLFFLFQNMAAMMSMVAFVFFGIGFWRADLAYVTKKQ